MIGLHRWWLISAGETWFVLNFLFGGAFLVPFIVLFLV